MGARLRGRQILTLYPLMAEKSGHLFAALLHRAGSPHVFGEGDREREEDLRVTLRGEFFPLVSVSQQHLPPLGSCKPHVPPRPVEPEILGCGLAALH